MTTETDTTVLGMIAERLLATAPAAQRAARHRALVGSTNAIISAQAEAYLSFDSDPRGFDTYVKSFTQAGDEHFPPPYDFSRLDTEEAAPVAAPEVPPEVPAAKTMKAKK